MIDKVKYDEYIESLLNKWEEIQKELAKSNPPKLLYNIYNLY